MIYSYMNILEVDTMNCYIKDKNTFKTKLMAPAQFELTVKSVFQEVSTVRVAGTEGKIAKGDYIFLGSFTGVINEIDIEKNISTLTCSDMSALFCRELVDDSDTAQSGVEDFIKRQIDKNYKNASDAIYRHPFLETIVKTITPSPVKPDIEKGFWRLDNFLSKALRLHDISVDFAPKKDKLQVIISKKQRMHHNIDFSLPDHVLLEEVVSAEQVGKITSVIEETNQRQDWYLLEDGSITKNYTTENRVDGKWEILFVKDADTVESEVKKRFEENKYSHLIEFASHKDYGFYDFVTIRTLKGTVFRSYISAIQAKSSDRMITYKTGEMRTTIDEKINLKLLK